MAVPIGPAHGFRVTLPAHLALQLAEKSQYRAFLRMIESATRFRRDVAEQVVVRRLALELQVLRYDKKTHRLLVGNVGAVGVLALPFYLEQILARSRRRRQCPTLVFFLGSRSGHVDDLALGADRPGLELGGRNLFDLPLEAKGELEPFRAAGVEPAGLRVDVDPEVAGVF